MASFSRQPILTPTKTVAGSATTIPTFSFCSFLPKRPQISKAGKRNHYVHRVACKATNNGDQILPSSSNDRQAPQGKFDRRDVLIGLGGLYGAGSLFNDPLALAAPVSVLRGGVALAAEKSAGVVAFPVVLDKVISTVVPRDRKSRSQKEKEDEEEVLVVDGIEFAKDAAVKFDVYINDDDESPSGPDKTEFAGSFVNVPHLHTRSKQKKTCLKLGITDLLDDLGVDDDDSVVVTLVPRYGIGIATIGGIKITLLS
jgi:hypothetical protein